METYMPAFDATNEKARARLYQKFEKHIAELQAAVEEYFAADVDQGDRRRLELEQYLTSGAGDRSSVYVYLIRALHRAYPKTPGLAPEFGKGPSLPVVKSPEEARARGLTQYAVVTEGPQFDIPQEWKDKNIEWGGGSVTEIIPTTSDQQNPARLTYDGKSYYRE